MNRNTAFILFIATQLAACDRIGPERTEEPPLPQTEAAIEAAVEAADGAPISIMRPDIEEAKRHQPELQPLRETIPFAEGGVELGEEALGLLRHVIASRQMAEGGPIVLRGHSDSIGSDRANLLLSRERAEAVRDYLVESGVDGRRISVVALGEMRQIAPNADLHGRPDEAGRAKNRRVELEIAVEQPPKSEDEEPHEGEGAAPGAAAGETSAETG